MGIYHFKSDDAERFARERGAVTRHRRQELQFKFCPYCRGGDRGADKWTFSINLETGAHNCQRATCGRTGNMVSLARDFGFSLGTEVDEYYTSRRQFKNLRKYPAPESRPEAIRYMESRGISRKTTERYHLTVRKDDENVLVFPFMDEDGAMQFIKFRNATHKKGDKGSKEWCLADCKPILFGMDQCDPEKSKTLFLTEGQIDSLSLAECGIENAVSVPTGAKGFTWVPYCWDFLGRFDTLVVFGDYEKGKITLLDEMAKRFHGTVKHVRPDDYQDCKDANELLLKHGKQAVINAAAGAIPVANPRIKDITDIKKVDVSGLEKLETGIRSLDRIIGGLYFGQLVLLTGERGLGKSTVGSQLITKAIDAGYTVLCYSGEMPDWQFLDWLTRQVAGPRHITATTAKSGYESYSVDGKKDDAIMDWLADKCKWYDNGLLADADAGENEALIDTLETAILQYGVRVLLVDNLMTAMDDDLSSDLYRQQGVFVKQLSFMAKRYNVIILLVVHPRKTNGVEYRNDDIAGSGNITNLADVILRYAVPKEDKTNPPDYPRILQVAKNRLSGRLHEGIPMYYDPRSKRVSDEDNFSWRLGWEEDAELPKAIDGFKTVDDGDEIPF